jgi:hypothetical protein
MSKKKSIPTPLLAPFFRGLVLVAPHGSYIADGSKTIVVKSRPFKTILDKRLLLIERKWALGIIKLVNFREGDLVDFKRFSKKHRITDDERKRWWPDKRTLYFYDVEIVRIFRKPLKIEYGTGPQVFVRPERIRSNSN